MTKFAARKFLHEGNFTLYCGLGGENKANLHMMTTVMNIHWISGHFISRMMKIVWFGSEMGIMQVLFAFGPRGEMNIMQAFLPQSMTGSCALGSTAYTYSIVHRALMCLPSSVDHPEVVFSLSDPVALTGSSRPMGTSGWIATKATHLRHRFFLFLVS